MHQFFIPKNVHFVKLWSTVTVLNFQTPENFAVTYLKFKQRDQTLGYFVIDGADSISNSVDPAQTAPLGCSLIWVYTVYPALSVRNIRIITVSSWKVSLVLFQTSALMS